MNLAGRKLTAEVGRVATQASGVAFMHYGDTVVLSTATVSSRLREGIDLFPLSAEYEEKLYSVGEIPGGFNKREGKASENTVLTRRVIDRPMYPLFSKDYHNGVTLDNVVTCMDPDCGPELTAMLGSTIATSISDVPFTGPYAITQVGLTGGQLTVNPIADQKRVPDTALIVASTREKVIMIEVGANEVSEQIMIDAVSRAHEVNQKIIRFIGTIVAECGKEKHFYESCAMSGELFAVIREIVTPQEVEEAMFTGDKQIHEKDMAEITAEPEEASVRNEEWLTILDKAVYQYQEETVRKMILKDHKHLDDRAITGIRHLVAGVDLLLGAHDSGMFTRGQTRVLNVCTLVPLSEVQRLDGLDENEISKRYIHRYNFLFFSVGEIEPSREPGRREIGHGALAERVLISILPSAEEFPYAIRTVSETMGSDGSTSRASVCTSILSLMTVGVPIREMVAGISYGLVVGDMDDDYLILTDIQGLKGFFGGMDFKVGGTKSGITAIQMDIKIRGLTRSIIEETIARARKVRTYIPDNVMRPVISEPRKHLSPYAPKIKQTIIDPQKIGDVAGRQDRVISKIIGETGVRADITDDGSVNVCGTDEAIIDRAVQIIAEIVTDIEVGMAFSDKVVHIMNFGASVELAPNKDGMIHISKLSDKRVGRVENVVNIGDEVTIKVTEADKTSRINLTIRPSDLTENKTAARTEEK